MRWDGSIMNKEWPAVSIIVPAYNAERAIASCVHSLLSLKYPIKEIIVVTYG
jgi:glycosyltransferase involved in cell wall biosynthesis